MVRKTQYRRRREKKTDYRARLALLRSFMPRIIIRKTNRYIVSQLVETKEAQDFVLCTANSKELLKHGWPQKYSGSLKSLPAAYLTGILLSNKIKSKKMNPKKVVVDLGIAKVTRGSRLFACVKGLIDSGVNVPYDEKILPQETRIYGRHTGKEIPVGEIKEKLLKQKTEQK